MNIFDYIFIFLILIILILYDYNSIRCYIRTNKDLFWALYHKEIINEFLKEFPNFDKDFWEEEECK